MLKLTKPEKETPYMKCIRVLLSATFLTVPLLFFTDLTANPFVVQSRLLYVLLALIYGALCIKFLRSKRIDFTRTFFDLAFFVYVLVCVGGWLSAVSSAPQALRQTMFYGLLDYGSLLLVAAMGAYFISKNVVFSGMIESKTRYIGLFMLWGALWLLFPMFKTSPLLPSIWSSIWSWYGALLWVVGIYLAVRLLKQLTQENILVLAFIACFLACLYGVLQAVGLEFLWPFEINQFASKAFSTFGNPNFLSSWVVMLLPPVLVYFMRTERRIDTLAYGGLVLVYILFLSFAAARSSWLGTVCALGMMWMFGSLRALIWSKKGRVFWLAVLAVAAGYGAALVDGSKSPVTARAVELAQVTPSNLTLGVEPDKVFTSLHQRLFMWDVSKEIFLSRPVTGAGLGNFQMAYAHNQPKTLLRHPNLRELKTMTPAPHNEFFFQLGQGGIVGLGLFLFMFMVLFLEVRDFASHKKEGDKKQLLQALFCGILGMLADNLFNISLHAVVPAFMFWWLVGAEVSGVGKEGQEIEITVNPATKAAALALLALCVGVMGWQLLSLSSEARSFTADKQYDAGLQEEALANYQKAVSLYPGNIEAGYKLGGVYLAKRQYKEALQAYEKTLAASSYREEIHYRAALAALGAHDTKKAVRHLGENIKLNPFALQSYLLLAQLAHTEIIYADEDVIKLLERGVELFPYQTDLWILTGEIYLKQMEKEYAKNIFVRALTIDTLSKELQRHVQALFDSTEQAPSVLPQAQKLQALQSRVGRYARLSAAEKQSLRSNLEQYTTQYPQDTNGPILLAQYFSLAGNSIKSKTILEEVLKTYPDDLWANLALSTLLFKAEDLEQAKYYLRRALFYYPQNQIAQKRLDLLS